MERLVGIMFGFVLVALGATAIVFHSMMHNNISTTQQHVVQQSTILPNSQTRTIQTPPLSPKEGIYLLNNSNNAIYLVFAQPVTKAIILNRTFIRGGPISPINGVLELQSTTIYSELENMSQVTIQLYNGISWITVTLPIYYTSQTMQPYAFLVPAGQVIPF